MEPILRNIGSVVAGLVVACMIMMVVESIKGHVLYPGLAKAVESVTDREALRKTFATALIGGFPIVILGWGIAGSAGGRVTSNSLCNPISPLDMFFHYCSLSQSWQIT